MPYAIWCTNCPTETLIGQGVRFNAEKKKIGNYYSTPIYSFRMKHTACGGWIEIKTDPKNTAYVVVDGARKRETGEDDIKEGDYVLRGDEEKERLRNDAFAALEVTIEDRVQANADRERIEQLADAVDKHWDDPYTANQRLRKAFRVVRKAREKDEAATEDLRDRMSLGIELLAESEDDRRHASFVEFGLVADNSPESVARKANSRALFPQKKDVVKPKLGRLKSEIQSAESRERLRIELGQNTRAAVDPFLSSKASSKTPLVGIKRKRDERVSDVTKSEPNDVKEAPNLLALVDYDSD
jgi:coiled-coil domain-containing protein 130